MTLALTSAVVLSLAASAPTGAALHTLAARAVDGDDDAIAALRAAGQPGLDALLATRAAPAAVVDRVAAQHDASSSGLYWYTDLDAARREAARTHKPIVSLRMLGRLDEELSCANSRFFRALLYADPLVARTLRARFVLHWQMVRPVPVVTVDMGDGRSFTTTITGNSVHLVLDERGAPVDAIPGMLSPAAFLAALDAAHAAARCGTRACVADKHAAALRRLDGQWRDDMQALGNPGAAARATGAAPDEAAGAIAERALSKAIVEVPVLRALDIARPESADVGVFRDVGRLHAREVKWHGPALARFTAGRSPAFAKKLVDEIAADTAQNEQRHHRAIHQWFARGDARTKDEAALTRAIYATVFATPDDDPWLGLGDAVDGAVRR